MRELIHTDLVQKPGQMGAAAGAAPDGRRKPGSGGGRWEAELRMILEDRRTPLHLIGLGNPLRSDDSVGLRIVSRLVANVGRRPLRNVFVHPPTDRPERLISRVDCRKERLLIFDAVEASRGPGEVVLESLGDSEFGYFATHNVPIRVIPDVAVNPSNVYVNGVEPGNLEVGEGLSDAVRSAADSISEIVESALAGGSDGPA